MTASRLSPLSRCESHYAHVRKLPVTWGKAVAFAGYSGFLHHNNRPVTTAGNKIPNPNFKISASVASGLSGC